MIRINEDWVILIDEYNYKLAKDLHKKVKKQNSNGPTDAFEIEGYYGGVSAALTALADKLVKDELKVGDRGLNEACTAIQRVYTELVETIKEAIPSKIVYEGRE